MIRTQNLARSFTLKDETVQAVRDVTVAVEPGELVAFLGPNGAGKTTTLKMLSTLLRPSSGTATVAGFDVREDPEEVRRRIGHIGQGNGTLAGLRVREELHAQGRFYGLDRHTLRKRSDELLDQLDLAAQADRDVGRLSGGQRRRLDIAMGLVHRPPLLFLDEPSSGLDPQSRANLWDHVSRFRQEQGMTIVLTTHYLEEADNVADRVVVIDHGEVIADGTADQLKAKVSGDLITVALAEPADVARAAELAARLPTTNGIETDSDTLRLRVDQGDTVLPELVRSLDLAGLRLLSTQVRRPTLDDVFLTLTGRSLRDDA